MRFLVLVAFLVLLSPAPAASPAAPPSSDRLRMGAVTLTVGMEEQLALSALRAHFHVERARGEGDDWAILQNGQAIAVVSFTDRKLARASKTWFSSSTLSATTMTDRLYSLAGQFSTDGRTQCVLSAKPYRLSGIEGKMVTLACGAKSIQFNESRLAHGGAATTLREVLQ